jgi:hypothetical protein
MAKLSRNARHKARVRRNLSLTRRQLKAVTNDFIKSHVTLLAVLGQAGGEIALTTETLQQTQRALPLLNWSLEPKQQVSGEAVKEWTLRLVVNEPATSNTLETSDDSNVPGTLARGE